MREEIRHYIQNNLMRNSKYPLEDDQPLISGGLIDSFSLVDLALFIEEQFGVHFDDFELTTGQTHQNCFGLL
jgi:acyl carrier protein